MFSRKLYTAAIAAAVLSALGWGMQAASAASVTVIGSGTNPDSSSATFGAEAIFNQSGTSLSITLENLTAAADMHSAKELLVGILFSPENAAITNANVTGSFDHSLSLSSKTGTIGGSGTTPTASNKTWTISSGGSSGTLLWGGANSGAPSTVIGGTSDTTTGDTVNYANINSSVDNESPEIYESVTFNLTVPATFDVTQLTSFTFLFNTDGSTHLTGTPGGGTPRSLPLPSSVWGGVTLIGAMGLLKYTRRRKLA